MARRGEPRRAGLPLSSVIRRHAATPLRHFGRLAVDASMCRRVDVSTRGGTRRRYGNTATME
ncbi:hypothetical protein BMAGB8_0188 [Burkholderia mallei GB8 horse 4]|nr:hypothetical protein BMAGB8_0188 [Burkholderia mallei GB8 horse 4]